MSEFAISHMYGGLYPHGVKQNVGPTLKVSCDALLSLLMLTLLFVANPQVLNSDLCPSTSFPYTALFMLLVSCGLYWTKNL